YGERHIKDKFVMDYFAVSMPDMSVFETDMNKKNEAHCYYLMGLGNFGLGKKAEAERWFKKALETDPLHQLSKFYISMIWG
ncbi:MAG: tetratricopeptide repeat protein, partial [Butyrivibrio sp.]|nr:tetratricopeptide repeat protein [Butyrivibrio sp.]